jgi:Reverse transcriptase (RNA-dependent DNA polymerase).
VAHHDALIYVSYAEKLSKKYEKYLDLNGMSMIPTAYRKKLHYSNINAAKDVFEFIVDSEKCWIIKGDFKGFFDNIRHKILYQNVYKVLNVKKVEF